MNNNLKEFLVVEAIKIANETIINIKEVNKKFAGNYIKRRNVGFEIIPSLCGGFNETKKYYSDIITGKIPSETQEAVFYDK